MPKKLSISTKSLTSGKLKRNLNSSNVLDTRKKKEEIERKRGENDGDEIRRWLNG